jgi:membrane-bound metal-dependent hydrolase YbcI (DUF457 family)
MPFTLFHLGPALAVGLPLQRYLHAPTFIVGNLILDVEPLLVVMLGLRYPMHGMLHTVVLACTVGLLLGFTIFRLEGFMSMSYKKIKLETEKPLMLRSFLLAGVFGAVLHVLFDALLYSEMEPFFPLAINPLLNLHVSMSSVYWFCVALGVLALVYYVGLQVYYLYKKAPKA